MPLALTVLISGFLLGTNADDADIATTASIQKLLDTQVADWNQRDLDAFCEGYWKSPKLVFQSGGSKNVGWETMRNRYRTRYQGEGKEMGTLAFREVEIEPLDASSAFVRGRWELTMKDGKKLGGLYTLILRKLPEGWRIVHDHTSAGEP